MNFGASFNLPGEVQTVGRGELFALWYLAEQLQVNSDISFITDNLNVHDTFHKGSIAARNSNNCDLWKAFVII